MSDDLTPKQEAFAQAYVETGNASEAYRRAYDAENMKPTTIMVKACHTLALDKIRARVGQLQGEAFERHEMTMDAIAGMLMEDRDFAHTMGAPSAAVSASNGLAKLFGYGAENVNLSNPDGSLARAPVYKMVDKDDGDSAAG